MTGGPAAGRAGRAAWPPMRRPGTGDNLAVTADVVAVVVVVVVVDVDVDEVTVGGAWHTPTSPVSTS